MDVLLEPISRAERTFVSRLDRVLETSRTVFVVAPEVGRSVSGGFEVLLLTI